MPRVPINQAAASEDELAATSPPESNGGEPTQGLSPLEDDAAAVLEKLKSDLAAATDRSLRAQADLENYRKRAQRELDEERRYANLPLLRDLLPVIDNLQRAIAAAEKTPEAASLLDGVRMVVQNFESALGRHHCRRIEALGRPFDPAFHEAIAQQPDATQPPGTVLLVAQDGYSLHERIVRPAQVVVCAAPAD